MNPSLRRSKMKDDDDKEKEAGGMGDANCESAGKRERNVFRREFPSSRYTQRINGTWELANIENCCLVLIRRLLTRIKHEVICPL
jgi:hypothetical protein